jgi:hypothetical protein
VSNQGLTYFKLLKEKISSQLRKSHPELPANIDEWKGPDIVLFQEDLLEKAGGQISEKWFYTHLKKDQDKLPRIDILNLLSEYAEFNSWADFQHQNKLENTLEEDPRMSLKKLLMLFSATLFVFTAIAYFAMPAQKAYTFEFHFYDQTHRNTISSGPITVTVFEEGQSPRNYDTDSNGVFIYESASSKIELEVKAPYYHSEHIIRELKKNGLSEEIYLKSNDYEMMIHFYACSDLIGWKKRRADLSAIIADEATIYQMHFGPITGAQRFNKREFLNIMSTPTPALKGLEILETEYSEGLITKLKFTMSR